LRDLDKQIISQLSLLGFDPAARSRLGLAEVKAQSTLEKLRQNRGKDNA
jgi:phage terminase small subunit